MVCDTVILISPLDTGFRHLFPSSDAIGGIGVAVQNASDVRIGDKPWQCSILCPLYLPPPFPELRLYVRQPKRAIHRILIQAGNQRGILTETLFRKRETLGFGESVQLGNVRIGAGREEESHAVPIRRADMERSAARSRNL